MAAKAVVSGVTLERRMPPISGSVAGLATITQAAGYVHDIDAVLAANPAAVADYRAGKDAAVGFLVGQVMKATRGQANAGMVQNALRERLDKAE